MATGNLGLSFLPGTQDNGNGMDPRRAGTRQAPIQEAIKILALRQPKFYGSQAIAPAPPADITGRDEPACDATQRAERHELDECECVSNCELRLANTSTFKGRRESKNDGDWPRSIE